MTPAEQQRLVDEAVTLLKQTTVGWANHGTAWQNNKTTKWWQALDKLAQLRADLNPAPTPPPPTPGKYGPMLAASVHRIWEHGVEQACRDLREKGGITWIRDEFHWSKGQPLKSSPVDFSLPDPLIDGAKKAGMSGVLLILNSPPGWAWTEADYAVFAWKVADRYETAGIEVALEFWNEPYMPKPYVEPGKFARMCKAAGDAVKTAAPNMKRMANVDTGDYKNGGQDYFARMISAVPSLASSLDAWSLHPYNGTYGPNDTSNPDAQLWRFDRVPAFQAIAAQRGASLPVWITEVGWTTTSNKADGVTEAQQATFTAQAVKRAVDEWAVQRVFVYMGERDSSDDKEGRFGVYRPDGTPKPVLAALKALT